MISEWAPRQWAGLLLDLAAFAGIVWVLARLARTSGADREGD